MQFSILSIKFWKPWLLFTIYQTSNIDDDDDNLRKIQMTIFYLNRNLHAKNG